MGQSRIVSVLIRPTALQINRNTSEYKYADFNKNGNTQTMCVIGQSNFTDLDTILQINYCGHVFLKKNLLTWFRFNSKCPVCRYDIRENKKEETPPIQIRLQLRMRVQIRLQLRTRV